MPRRRRPRKARSRRTAFFRRSRAAQGGAPARLLVGLGNPGADAARHRHNVGFMALDALATAHGFSSFKRRTRFHGEIAEGRLGDEAVLTLKPQTYMNESGRAVGAAMRFHRLEPTAVIVLHDEVDLAAGKVRAKCGGGVAGHNGLRSIRAHIGADFWRVRIGIGHPGDRDRMTGHVLSSFGASDRGWLDPTLDAIVDAFPLLMAGDASAFMSRVALLAPPPGSGPAQPRGETPSGPSGGV
ncbi:MAG: aminoacyl-tRNA hydrolase [Rhodospirillales bacterium]|nr:aminoacyl-tRNA hydrolase [Rhodospirillales bacterium]